MSAINLAALDAWLTYKKIPVICQAKQGDKIKEWRLFVANSTLSIASISPIHSDQIDAVNHLIKSKANEITVKPTVPNSEQIKRHDISVSDVNNVKAQVIGMCLKEGGYKSPASKLTRRIYRDVAKNLTGLNVSSNDVLAVARDLAL